MMITESQLLLILVAHWKPLWAKPARWIVHHILQTTSPWIIFSDHSKPTVQMYPPKYKSKEKG
jgi:hypothetical protein